MCMIKCISKITIILILLYNLIGCSVKIQNRILTEPDNISTLNKAAKFLKAHMLNGNVYIVSEWIIFDDETKVIGQGKYLNLNRELINEGDFTISVDSVAIFESNIVSTSGSVSASTVVTGASLVLTAYCISNPKACFGSCPTFYADINGQSKLVAEGFSSSVAPSLEKTDIDALFQVQPKGNKVKLTLTNEALETHVIKYANLLAFPKIDGRVYHDTKDGFYQSGNVISPAIANSNNNDCLPLIKNYDSKERFSLTDSLNLATKETIELTFVDLPKNNIGIVIGCRQSLLSTYLLYQTLSFMGSRAGEWIASLEKMEKEFS